MRDISTFKQQVIMMWLLYVREFLATKMAYLKIVIFSRISCVMNKIM